MGLEGWHWKWPAPQPCSLSVLTSVLQWPMASRLPATDSRWGAQAFLWARPSKAWAEDLHAGGGRTYSDDPTLTRLPSPAASLSTTATPGAACAIAPTPASAAGKRPPGPRGDDGGRGLGESEGPHHPPAEMPLFAPLPTAPHKPGSHSLLLRLWEWRWLPACPGQFRVQRGASPPLPCPPIPSLAGGSSWGRPSSPPPHWQLSACGDQAMTSDCDGFCVQGVWRELYQGRRLWLCVCVCGCVCMRECVAVREQHSHGWVWVSAMGAVTVGVFMCDMWLGGGGSVCVCVCVCDLHLASVLAGPGWK